MTDHEVISSTWFKTRFFVICKKKIMSFWIFCIWIFVLFGKQTARRFVLFRADSVVWYFRHVFLFAWQQHNMDRNLFSYFLVFSRHTNTLCGISFRIASQNRCFLIAPLSRMKREKKEEKISLCFPVVSDKEIVRPLLTHVIRIAF